MRAEHRYRQIGPVHFTGFQGREAGVFEGGAKGVLGDIQDKRPFGVRRADAPPEIAFLFKGDKASARPGQIRTNP